MTNIDKIKELLASYKDEDFGEMMKLEKCGYIPPEMPPKTHPRLYLTPKRVDEINDTLLADENKYAYEKYIQHSETECDGFVYDHTSTESLSHFRIIDSDIHTIIQAKALRYALTKEEKYGYEAVAATMAYLKTFDLSKMSDQIKIYTAQAEMEMVACVYDWCYDLLTEDDKRHIAMALTGKFRNLLDWGSEFPPKNVSVMVSHMLVSIWYAIGIALYDEYPDIYNHIAEMLYEDSVPAQDFYLGAGEHPMGSAYGPLREIPILRAEIIHNVMFDGKSRLFTDKIEDTCLAYLHNIRPDGEMLRTADDFNEGTRNIGTTIVAFMAASIYKNPILKGFARKEFNDFSTFVVMRHTPVQFLLLNDPKVKCGKLSDLPLVHYCHSPRGTMYARTSWEDKDAVMTYMKIGEGYAANHEHKDAGSFQIFHKGILASKGGFYGMYNEALDCAYTKQTIAKNSLLIFNPNMKDNGRWIYSGGQLIDDQSNETPLNIEHWNERPSSHQAKILYHGYKIKDEKLVYTALSGDITNAYDKETVDEVKRYMFSFMTGSALHPMVFVVFDRITAKDESYKKTFLLHMETRPLIAETPDKKPCAVVTNLSSKLYVQSLVTDVDYTAIGGKGKEYLVNGINYPESEFEGQPFLYRYNAETGWGRIEISPKKKSKTDCLLTVMYIAPDTDYSPKMVFGNSNVMPFHEAVEIKGDGVLGAYILNTAVVFPENGDGFESSAEFTVPQETKKLYINGVEKGVWEVNGEKVNVDESGIIEAEVKANNIKLRKTDE